MFVPGTAVSIGVPGAAVSIGIPGTAVNIGATLLKIIDTEGAAQLSII